MYTARAVNMCTPNNVCFYIHRHAYNTVSWPRPQKSIRTLKNQSVESVYNMRCVMCLERECSWNNVREWVSSGHPLSILDNNSELLERAASHYLSALGTRPNAQQWRVGELNYESRERLELLHNTLHALDSLSAAALSVLHLLGFRTDVRRFDSSRWAWRAAQFCNFKFIAASHPDTRRHSCASLLVSKSTDAWVLSTCSLETEKFISIGIQ